MQYLIRSEIVGLTVTHVLIDQSTRFFVRKNSHLIGRKRPQTDDITDRVTHDLSIGIASQSPLQDHCLPEVAGGHHCIGLIVQDRPET